MANVFIIYARRDEPRTDRLVGALEAFGEAIDVWYGKRQLSPGFESSALFNALEKADIFLLCVSAEPSEYVEGGYLTAEKKKALERAQSDPRVRIVNVTFGTLQDVPEPFRQFPTETFATETDWLTGIDGLRKRIL